MAKRIFDRFDQEAEREGSALKNRNYIKPRGKRILKIKRGHETGAVKIETRIDKRYVCGPN